MTWMEMFNDLRAIPEIRGRYQFWFYLYPTGQPFWVSAAQMREDLADVRADARPAAAQNRELDQMVLVGHSMGGLGLASCRRWKAATNSGGTVATSRSPTLKADPKIRDGLAETFYFAPNPSVRRVITIGTPHRGSEFANDLKWLGRKLITLPTKMIERPQ